MSCTGGTASDLIDEDYFDDAGIEELAKGETTDSAETRNTAPNLGHFSRAGRGATVRRRKKVLSSVVINQLLVGWFV